MKGYVIQNTKSSNFDEFNVSNYILTLEGIVASQSGDNNMVNFLSILFPTIDLINTYIPATYLSLPLVTNKYRIPLALISYIYTHKLGYLKSQDIPSVINQLQLVGLTLNYSISELVLTLLRDVETDFNNIYRINKGLKVLYDTSEDLFKIEDNSFYDMFKTFSKAIKWGDKDMDYYNLVVTNDSSMIIASLGNLFRFSNTAIENLIKLKNDYDFHLLG